MTKSQSKVLSTTLFIIAGIVFIKAIYEIWDVGLDFLLDEVHYLIIIIVLIGLGLFILKGIRNK